MSQFIHVVGIFIAAGYGERTGADHFLMGMADTRRIARTAHASGQHGADPRLALDLAQEQHTAIRGQGPAIKTGMDIERFNRRQTGQDRSMVAHGGVALELLVRDLVQEPKSYNNSTA